MTDTTASHEWAGERGRKWVEHLAATEVMLSPIDEPLLTALSLDGVRRVADIGCGGGRTSRAVAARLPSDAVVHGVDVSPDVIAAAKAATKELESAAGTAGATPASDVSGQQGASVEFRCDDAGSGSPAQPLYDRLSSRFGVMFFDDPPAAFANLAGWLRPGGRFAFAVWGRLPDNPWMLSLRQVIAEEVEVPAPPPDSPGPFRYADAGRFCALLEAAGFAGVSAEPWHGEVELGGGLPAADAAAFCLTAFSVGELLGNDAGRLARVCESLTAILAKNEVNGVVRMPAAVHIVTGGR